MVGGQQEHTDVARTLISAYGPSITAAVGHPLQELPSIYSYFNSMLQDDERAGGDEPEGAVQPSSTTRSAAASTPAAVAGCVVAFCVKCDTTSPGESVGLIGGCAELGAWKEEGAVAMDPSAWPEWKLSLSLPVSSGDIEYKYVKFLPDGGQVTEWEAGDNRKVSLTAGMSALAVDNGAFGSAVTTVINLVPPAPASSGGEQDQVAAEEAAAVSASGSADPPVKDVAAAAASAPRPFMAASVTRMPSMEDLWKDAGASGEIVGETVEEVVIGGLVVSLRIRIAKVDFSNNPGARAPATHQPPTAPPPAAAAAPAPLSQSSPMPPPLPAQAQGSQAEEDVGKGPGSEEAAPPQGASGGMTDATPLPAAMAATRAAAAAATSQVPPIVASAAAVAAEVEAAAAAALEAAEAMKKLEGDAGVEGEEKGGWGRAGPEASTNEASGNSL